jgi:hypothetical protein
LARRLGAHLGRLATYFACSEADIARISRNAPHGKTFTI